MSTPFCLVFNSQLRFGLNPLTPTFIWRPEPSFSQTVTPGILANISRALLLVKFPFMLESFKTSFFLPEYKTLSFVSGILSGLCCFVTIMTVFNFLTESFSCFVILFCALAQFAVNRENKRK